MACNLTVVRMNNFTLNYLLLLCVLNKIVDSVGKKMYGCVCRNNVIGWN